MRTRPPSWPTPRHVDCPTRRSSPLLRPGKQLRWPTSQPMTWELRRMRSGQPLLPLSPVRQSQHASGNETGSEKEFPRRFESWSLMISSVEARSAGTPSTTDAGSPQAGVGTGFPGCLLDPQPVCFPVGVVVIRSRDRTRSDRPVQLLAQDVGVAAGLGENVDHHSDNPSNLNKSAGCLAACLVGRQEMVGPGRVRVDNVRAAVTPREEVRPMNAVRTWVLPRVFTAGRLT
jgi:hypothetical protein